MVKPAVAVNRGTGRSGPTIYDIAKAVGVAPSTVSRALNRPERVSDKTVELVRQAASDLNHQANPFARALSLGRTSTLGLIVSDITNPSFFDLIRGAETAAAARNYTLVLADSAENRSSELTAARRVLAAADGLILASPRMNDAQITDLGKTKPLVVINRDVDGAQCVVPDVRRGIGQAVRTLATNGHRRLIYVAGPEHSWMSGKRWDAIRDACAWSRLDATLVTSGKPTVEGGREAARQLLATGATAVMAYNDLLAIGLMQELQAGGICVPDDISIIGFDDIFGANFTTPALSTIRSSMHSCGSRAATYLLDLLHDGPAQSEATLEVPTELVLRGSNGRPSMTARP